MTMQGKPVLAEELAPHVLREYALLADGERGVVVGPRGDCCWMCLPAGTAPRCCVRCWAGAVSTPCHRITRGSCGAAATNSGR
ncbi:glycosyl hydrolase domain protein [Mycobacterium xenopi 4042]|uniref:Glycosyl hydrolase domain protein n=1 Tax=Mycobacterium xenopi 4042 TaxID=1299334 RepID=X8CFA6_MYCXE|nr:glycosyl hydrolase domain protein [Mycobacterium xenopi 4042]